MQCMSRSCWSVIFPLLALLLLTVAAYFTGLSGPLLFDDHAALTDNLLVKIDGSTFDAWRTAAVSSHAGPLRRPVAMVSFAANHALAGEFSTFSLKATNLAIHLLIALLVFHLSVAILSSRCKDSTSRRSIFYAAMAASAFWALHPLHVSTVLYVVQRMAQLSTLFVMLGMLLFVRRRVKWARQGGSPEEIFATFLWLLLITVLATLSKENGILLLWLIVVAEATLFRGEWAGKTSPSLAKVAWVFFLVPIILVLLTLLYLPDVIHQPYVAREFTLQERLMTQMRILWHYVYWLIVPDTNAMGFQHDDILVSQSMLNPVSTWVAAAGWSVSLFLAWVCRLRYPLFIFGLLFYLVAHSMESSIFALEMVYEHRNYLPSVGLCIVLGAFSERALAKYASLDVRIPLLGVSAVLLVLLSIRSITWSNDISLSRADVENHPASARSHYFHADAMLKRAHKTAAADANDPRASELLILARHNFERMYLADKRDVAALVILFYLDSVYFSKLQEQVNWLDELEPLLKVRVLQSSDLSSLAVFFDCLTTGSCVAPESRVLGILDTLIQRYPDSVNFLIYKDKYLDAKGVSNSQLIPLVEDALARNPRSISLYPLLVGEYARLGSKASVSEALRKWLYYDNGREDIARIKRVIAGAN